MYRVRYYCTNCDRTFVKEIPGGALAPSRVTCPNCECGTGEKVYWPRYHDIRWFYSLKDPSPIIHDWNPLPQREEPSKWPTMLTWCWEHY